MNNVYLAARYSWKDMMKEAAEQLTIAGYTVTSRWIFGNKRLGGLGAARMDISDMNDADTLIMFSAPNREGAGRHIELGYALATGMKIYVVGESESVFHALEQVTIVDSLKDVIKAEHS